jgi:hypothetical protein
VPSRMAVSIGSMQHARLVGPVGAGEETRPRRYKLDKYLYRVVLSLPDAWTG